VHLIFPQVLRIVRQFLDKRVDYHGANKKEIGLERYRQLIVERLLAAVEPDEGRDDARLLPRIERFRPKGSTAEVEFSTVRPCRQTLKSHVSHVILDADVWEGSVAFQLEASHLVKAYVKNDHLGLMIPYEFEQQSHLYEPDFLVRLVNDLMLILEVKGQEREQDRQKYAAARRWVSAVNNSGRRGRWAFEVCKKPAEVGELLRKRAG